jgi:quercetin dioxygenase-like cupin family protein
VVSGRLRVACGDESYDVGPGEATLNPGGMPHGVTAVEDTVCVSVKDLVVPGTEATADGG